MDLPCRWDTVRVCRGRLRDCCLERLLWEVGLMRHRRLRRLHDGERVCRGCGDVCGESGEAFSIDLVSRALEIGRRCVRVLRAGGAAASHDCDDNI
jgi:hypothetical protein